MGKGFDMRNMTNTMIMTISMRDMKTISMIYLHLL